MRFAHYKQAIIVLGVMSVSEQESAIVYKVVVNHEEQYSIWPVDRENALGWRDAGFSGSKDDSLSYIKEHWTDMRPLSLRQQMAQPQPIAATVATTPSSDVINGPLAAQQPALSAVGEAPATLGAADDKEPAAQVTVASEAKPKRGFFGRMFGGGKKDQ